MTPTRTPRFLLAAGLCATLAACGGGGDDAPAPAAPAEPSFAACFDVTAGAAFVAKFTDEGGQDAGRGSVLLVQEPFEGAARSGSVSMSDSSSTAVRSSAFYWTQDSTGIRFWGDLDYDSSGSAETKTVHSAGFTLPLALQAGQSAALAYTDTVTALSGPSSGQSTSTNRQETWTFEGFETLTLGGKTFANTCRIKTVQAAEDGPSTLWFAKGFGLIRARHTNAAGAVLEESVLETVTAQP